MNERAHLQQRPRKLRWRFKSWTAKILLVVVVLAVLAALLGLAFDCQPGHGPGAGQGEGTNGAEQNDEENGEPETRPQDSEELIDQQDEPLDFFLFRFDTELIDGRLHWSGTLVLPDHTRLRLEEDERRPRAWEPFRDRLRDTLRDQAAQFSEVRTVYVETPYDDRGDALLREAARRELTEVLSERVEAIEEVKWVRPGEH